LSSKSALVIYEGSCDTEDNAVNSSLITGIIDILIENSSFKL